MDIIYSAKRGTHTSLIVLLIFIPKIYVVHSSSGTFVYTCVAVDEPVLTEAGVRSIPRCKAIFE